MDSSSGTAGGRWARYAPWGLVALAAGAWLVRALPFLHRHGALGYPIAYDEGVYFTASALLWRGLLPYQDFTFVHPPGALLLWSPASVLSTWLEVDASFALARWMATAIGGLNVFLVGRLALRQWGLAAGVVAALAYAAHPEAVSLERGPFLEPLLNLCCLGLANVWLEPVAPERERRRWLGAGVLAGLALSVKALGGIWLAAALLSRPTRSSWAGLFRLVLTAGLSALLIIGPLAMVAPGAFWKDVLWFQSQRPEDGALERWSRLAEMLHERRLFAVVLAMLGLLVALVRAFRTGARERAAERFVAAAYLLTVGAYLASRSYWSNYNAFLAPAESLLAGLGAAALVGWAAARGRGVAGVAWVLAVLAPLYSLRETLRGAEQRAPEVVALGRYVRQSVPAHAPVCTFEPGWGLVAARLPPVLAGAPLVVDSYALMLQGAMESGRRYADASAAFQDPGSQREMRRLLERCEFVVLGWRGGWQLSRESRQWFDAHFVQRFPVDTPGLELWARRGAGQ